MQTFILRSIIDSCSEMFSKALILVIKQSFVTMSSLNVDRNLLKVVYTKLEKYSAEADDVCS